MAQPKRRWSKARNLVECPHCHEMMQQHRICPACGYYDGEKVVSVKSDNEE